jgi:hypothetical protein
VQVRQIEDFDFRADAVGLHLAGEAEFS